MKWIFYVIVFIYMAYRAVYGANVKAVNDITIDKIDYGNETYIKAGTKKAINCRGSTRNQRLEWLDPHGKVIKRVPTSRVFTQEHIVSNGGRASASALLLVFSELLVKDTGLYKCRSGARVEDLSLCVMIIEQNARIPVSDVAKEQSSFFDIDNLTSPKVALCLQTFEATFGSAPACPGSHCNIHDIVCLYFTSRCRKSPSEFINTPTEVSAELGRSITLSCQAAGDPEPNLAWVRDYNEITESNNTAKHRVNTKYNSQGFESLLTITDLEPEDSGVYQCIAVQHPPALHYCENVAVQNISLQVSYAPFFENANDTKAVYGSVNDIVDMTCTANAFPAPTYRWFKSVSEDTLAEFDKKQIIFFEEENKAVLKVTATPMTFGKTYKCLATNSLGEAEKYFTLLKIQAPKKPDAVMFEFATDSTIDFSVSWLKLEFPVSAFSIQYLSTKKRPTEREWKRATEVYKEVDDDLIVLGFQVTLDELEEDSSYWVRMKASNDAGQSPWSDPVFATTDVKSELEPEPEEVDDDDAEKDELDGEGTSTTFYGLFFAGGIAVAAVLFMFTMRLV